MLVCFRKHSSGDLHSRLKTRKLLGVGETDDGDVHRSKVSVQCHTHYTSMNEMLDVVWVDLTVEVAYIPANTIVIGLTLSVRGSCLDVRI